VPNSAFSHPAGKIGLRAVGNTLEANRTGLKIDKMERKRLGDSEPFPEERKKMLHLPTAWSRGWHFPIFIHRHFWGFFAGVNVSILDSK
jgi:hypothetical protein